MTISSPSIFNNVIGPIMRGPSSSHTAAAIRIGWMASRLLGQPVKRCVVRFDPEGSLATTYRGQGSAMGLAAGLLGMEMSDPHLVKAERILAEQGVELEFVIESYQAGHPNTYKMQLTGKQGTTLDCTALSTGGGLIKLVELNGEKIENDSEYVHPLLPVPPAADATLPFTSVDELDRLLDTRGGMLSSYAINYECSVGNVTREDVLGLARRHLEVMLGSVAEGKKGTVYDDRILPPQSHLIPAAEQKGRLIPAPLVNGIISAVTAVMECKSSMGLIAAAPTAGSCGTLAGALTAVGETMEVTKDQLERALMAAGLIGVFIARKGGFAAEEGGCQYECGAASGMTAAALVEVMGGEARLALAAASMGLQNTLGLICDPVADRVEVPCLGKNIMAALNGLAAANMVLAGFAHLIPLQQVIDAMQEVGEGMDSRYCCTCRGGLSITPEAQRIHRSFKT